MRFGIVSFWNIPPLIGDNGNLILSNLFKTPGNIATLWRTFKAFYKIAMKVKLIKLFLRLSIGAGFLSAVGDRFGFWSNEVSVWGNWDNFIVYTQSLNPLIPQSLIPLLGWVSTALEIVFGLCLIFGFKTSASAKWSGWLLLIFALAMTFTRGVKAPLDYSVFAASAGAFGLSLIKEKFLELDILIRKNRR